MVKFGSATVICSPVVVVVEVVVVAAAAAAGLMKKISGSDLYICEWLL